MTRDEERKFAYLLSKAKVTRKELDDRFRKIDEMMNQISVGSMVYEPDEFGDFAYPQKVIEIVDRDSGIIKTYEESINRTQTICILERHLTYDDACLLLKW